MPQNFVVFRGFPPQAATAHSSPVFQVERLPGCRKPPRRAVATWSLCRSPLVFLFKGFEADVKHQTEDLPYGDKPVCHQGVQPGLPASLAMHGHPEDYPGSPFFSWSSTGNWSVTSSPTWYPAKNVRPNRQPTKLFVSSPCRPAECDTWPSPTPSAFIDWPRLIKVDPCVSRLSQYP